MFVLIKKLTILSEHTLCWRHDVCGVQVKLSNLINVTNVLKINHLDMIVMLFLMMSRHAYIR
jgi:hypothetical protein